MSPLPALDRLPGEHERSYRQRQLAALGSLPEIAEVTIDPSYDFPGAVEYEADGTPVIVLREYDERVLLHECIHAIFAREAEARAALTPDQEERVVRHLTRALYLAGWRLRVTDRSIAQVERELNDTARQRDELGREVELLREASRPVRPMEGDAV